MGLGPRFPFSTVDLFATLIVLKSACEVQLYDTMPQENSCHLWQFDILDLFHQGGDSDLSSWEHIQILDMNLLPLPTELLPDIILYDSQCA